MRRLLRSLPHSLISPRRHNLSPTYPFLLLMRQYHHRL